MTRGGMVSLAQARFMALEGGLVLAVTILLCGLPLHIGGLSLTPIYLPAAIIYLWPRQADVNTSLWIVFAGGLLQDLSSGMTAGMFALTWLLLWLFVNGEARDMSGGLRRQWINFSAVILAVMVLSAAIGLLALQAWPSIIPLFLQALISWALFPVIFWLRQGAKRVLGSDR